MNCYLWILIVAIIEVVEVVGPHKASSAAYGRRHAEQDHDGITQRHQAAVTHLMLSSSAFLFQI